MVRSFPLILVKIADDLPTSIPPAAGRVQPWLQLVKSEIKTIEADALSSIYLRVRAQQDDTDAASGKLLA